MEWNQGMISEGLGMELESFFQLFGRKLEWNQVPVFIVWLQLWNGMKSICILKLFYGIVDYIFLKLIFALTKNKVCYLTFLYIVFCIVYFVT